MSTSQTSIVQSVLKLRTTSVFVVGDLILDTYIHGTVNRISPEAPVPVFQATSQSHVLGGAANVAANIRSLGGEVILCGRIGQDSAGEIFLKTAQRLQIPTESIIRSSQRPTTQKTRVQAPAQQLIRIDEEDTGEITLEEEKMIELQFGRFCARRRRDAGAALVLSDYHKGVLTEPLIRSLISQANAAEIPVVTDPKRTDLRVYAGSTVLKPNLAEALLATASRADEPSVGEGLQTAGPTDLALNLAKISQVRNVVLSLSERGVVCAGTDVGPETRTFPASPLQIADVSGAGDTLVAVLALAIGAGLSVERAAELGNIAAGIVCGKPGTATISAAELVKGYQLADPAHLCEKMVTAEEAMRISERLRAEGQRIVFTNGCFDIIHPGHIHSLTGSRKLGKFLFVGLNSDSSVKKLKGPERPVQNEESRATVLAGLSCVDFVVLFDEETPIDLIRMIRPDVLTKGGDYQKRDIVGHEEVESWGGEVRTIPLIQGQSTTEIIRKSRGNGDSK